MTDSSADRDPLDRLAEDFVARLRRGEHPAIDDYAARHPELAEQVRELFPALVEMEQLKPAAGDHTGAFEPTGDPTDPDRVGEFRILRRVGHGGMGVVYEAVQESLGRHVALKLLPAEAVADPRRLERFRREARAAARLHHTNIVPVFGVGAADGRHFYAMQFIPGHPLDAVIAEVQRLKANSAALPAPPRAVSEVAGSLMSGTFANAPSDAGPAAPSGSSPALSGTTSGGHGYWATVARIGAQVADALAYAHGQGVLHRDVKPANLLLDPTGTVWVTDFGLAKSADADDLTHAGDIVGTLRYMAPERFDGAGDGRADVYALGLTLYELLTLQPAFAAENRAKLVQQVTDANPPRPRAVNGAIPRDLETIVLKATARDPAARYQSAAALADDLRRFLDGRTITARRSGPLERAWRAAKRAPVVTFLLGLTAALLVAGTAVSVFFAVRADGARRDANDRADDLKRERDATADLLYLSQMSQAGTAAAEYRTDRLLGLLADTTPAPGGPDRRGWEWHYLDRLARPWQSEVRLDFAAVPTYLPVRSTLAGIGFGGPPNLIAHSAVTADGGRLVVPPTPRYEGSKTPPAPGGVFELATGKVVRVLPPSAEPENVVPPGPMALLNQPVPISPDGRFTAAVEQVPGETAETITYRVRVTELATGKEAAPPLVVAHAPAGVAVGPGADRVVVLQDPGDTNLGKVPHAVVWERHTGKARSQHLRMVNRKRHVGLQFMTVSPDGAVAVAVFGDGPPTPSFGPNGGPVLEVHDLRPGGTPQLHESVPGFYLPVLSPGGKQVAVFEGAAKRTVRVLDVKTGWWAGRWTIPPAVPLGWDRSGGGLPGLAVGDGGRRVVVDAGNDLLVVGGRMTDGADAPWRTAVVRQPPDPVSFGGLGYTRMWVAPDDSRVVVGTRDGVVLGYPLAPFPGLGRTWPELLTIDGVPCVPAPGPRGERVLYASFPGAVRFTPEGGPAPPNVGPAAGWPVAVYDPAAATLGPVRRLKKGTTTPVALAPDGRRAAVFADPPDESTPGEWLHLLALDRDGTPLRSFPPTFPPPGFSGTTQLSRGGRWLVRPEVPDPPGKFQSLPPDAVRRHQLWALDTGAPAGAIPADRDAWAGLRTDGLAFAPDDSLACVQTYLPPAKGRAVPVTLRVYDPATGRELWAREVAEPVATYEVPDRDEEPTVHPYLPGVAFAPDGRELVVSWRREDGTIRVRVVEAATGAPRRDLTAPPAAATPVVFGHGGHWYQVLAFGPGGRLAVADNRDVLAWDAGTDAPRRLPGHANFAGDAAFSADGRRLFVLDAANDRRLHVWDVATGREVLVLRDPNSPAVGLLGVDGWRERLWIDGERVCVLTGGGVRVFDGTPRGK